MAANNNQLTEWLVALSPLGNVHCIESILTKLFAHLNNPLAKNRSLSTIFRYKNIVFFRVWLLIRAAFKSHRYPFIHLGGERRCESKVSCDYMSQKSKSLIQSCSLLSIFLSLYNVSYDNKSVAYH